MDFFENLESDTDCIFEDSLSSAEEMEIIPGGAGSGVVVKGMFEAPGVNSLPSGISAGIVSTAPMLHIPEKYLRNALGRPLLTRDVIIIRDKRYRPQNPQGDGFGLLSCKLLRCDNG